MEIYKSIDLKNNELKNVVIEKKTENEITNMDITEGKLVYDSTNKLFYGFNNSEALPFNTGLLFNSVVVETDLNNGTLEAEIGKDSLTLKQGTNVKFEYDDINKSITVNADVAYSAENFSQIFGNTEDVEYTITHNLGSPDIVVSVIVNAGASTHPDLTVERFTTIDENNVSIRLNTPPGIETLTAVIASKQGERGLQGEIGPQGPIGPQGATGNDGTLSDLTFPVENENSIIFVSEQQLTASDGVTFDGNLLALQGSNLLVDNGTFEHNNVADSDEHFKITYNHTTPTPTGNKILNVVEKIENGAVLGSYFNLTSDGKVYFKSVEEGYTNNKQTEELYLSANDSNGNLYGTSIDIQNGAVFKEVQGTITSEQIKQSYSTPIVIIPAKTGYLIDVHNIFVKYEYSINPYNWSNKTGFVFPSANDFLAVLYSQMIQGNKSGYQKISVNVTDDPLKSFYYPNEALVFKTLTANPSAGEGQLKYIVRYSYVTF